MNVQLTQMGSREYTGTRDLNKYHWYAIRTGGLVRGGIAERNGRKTAHEEALYLGGDEARYVGTYTRSYVALPFCEDLQRAVARVWKGAV
jgi:hypothetical protein